MGKVSTSQVIWSFSHLVIKRGTFGSVEVQAAPWQKTACLVKTDK